MTTAHESDSPVGDSPAGVPSTREQLLRATIEIAGEQGQHMVTHRSVAARAQVAHGLVRHYFGSREELLAEAIETAITEDIHAVKLATDDPDAFAEGVASTDRNWPRDLLQYEVVLSAIRGNAADAALSERLYNGFLGEISQTLEALDIDDPDGSWSAFLVAAVDGLVLQHAFFRSEERTERILGRLRDTLRRLAADSDPAG